jgi:hypothetical protein
MQPLSVQVIAYAPTIFRHCQHCEVAFQGIGVGERMHQAELANALPDELLDDFARVSDWVHRLVDRHGNRVAVSVVDAASIEGVWKSLRHGARRYPAVVIDGRTVRAPSRDGSDLESASELIDERLGTTAGRIVPGSSVEEKGEA